MSILKPFVGVVLLALGLLSAQHALSVGSQATFQLWAFPVGYVVSGVLVLLGKEVGAWFGVTVSLITLLIVGAEVLRLGGGVELPLLSWITVLGNAIAFVGSILLLRADPPTAQQA